MNNLDRHGTTETEIESLSRSRQNLSYVRQELIEYRPDIVDDTLRERITEWLAAGTDRTPASAQEHLSQTLHSIRDDNAMYRETGMTNAEDAFPDRCRGCPHYGTRCPVLTKTSAIKHRERIFQETDDPAERRRKLREYAIEHNCHVIKEAIDELAEDHEPLLAEGQLLLMLVEEELLHNETDEELIRKLTNKVEHVRGKRVDDRGHAGRDETAEAGETPSVDEDDAEATAGDVPLQADGSGHTEVSDGGV